MRDTEWNEPVFEPMKIFESGGVKIAVLGQAFPYTPVANPRWMMPKWSFGIREEDVRANVEKARKGGAQLVVLLSHNGFDVDRKLAARVAGIDVILTSHTHDALPEAIKVGNTLLIASGSHGKFVSRLDLDVQNGAVKDFRYKLIPLFADAIKPDAEMTAAITKARAPYAKELARVVGKTDSLLYRRGNFNGTFDDVICAALLKERDAEIALSPGFRWGTSVLPGQPITIEDIHNATAITYPQVYRMPMSGRAAQGRARGCGRQSVQPRPLLPAGRRHGALRRARLRHRRGKTDRPANFRHDPPEIRQADRAEEGLHGSRLGERQRRHRRPAGVGTRRTLRRGRKDRARCAQRKRENFRGLAAFCYYIHDLECDMTSAGKKHLPGNSPMTETTDKTRRRFLAGAAGLAAAAAARPALADNPKNLPPSVPDWTRSLGDGVGVRALRPSVEI